MRKLSCSASYLTSVIDPQHRYLNLDLHLSDLIPIHMSRVRNDGVENWFVEEGPSNRMILALRSFIPEEADWSLQRLLRASSDHNDRFVLDKWHASVDTLLLWPRELFEIVGRDSPAQAVAKGSALWDFERSNQKDLHRRAIESLLVIRNAGLNDPANGKLLSTSLKLQRFLLEFLSGVEVELLIDQLAEVLILLLDILHNMFISSSLDISSIQENFVTELPLVLVQLLQSKDRAILIATLRVALALSSPNPADPTADPLLHFSSVFIQASIKMSLSLLLLPPSSGQNISLRSLALDILYTHTSDPTHAAGVLKRKDIGPVSKIVAKGLFEGSEKKETPFILAGGGRGTETGEAWEGAPPGRGELDQMAGMAEPLRSTYWMQRTFLPAPKSYVPQTQFWQLYREAFSQPYLQQNGVPPLLTATELINNVSFVFPGAQASLHENTFVMKGMKVRSGRSVPSVGQLHMSTYETLQTSLNPTTKSPTGTSFTCALILRNLSRALVELLDADSERQNDQKKKVQSGELFGLPIPDDILSGSQSQDGPDGVAESMISSGLTKEEEKRAVAAVLAVEDVVLEWVMKGGDTLDVWLSEVLRSITLLSA
ncbi:DNA-binding RFX-type winged-helix domain [Phaffia rhodozyma]|uniref:DNA-binding RFX-type winged-helix domain n=1 Tax=Phaffia rhodozyma TaxID=264483 RepID=A0A0F7SNC8_PHARH|nr:DNA-binding RFX-type winged-helix domain [Phaffia rhodozyma]